MSQEELKATSKCLEETSATLTHTKGRLEETEKVLGETRLECNERGFLVTEHMKNEQALHGEATAVSCHQWMQIEALTAYTYMLHDSD